jgi:hypothetical protein
VDTVVDELAVDEGCEVSVEGGEDFGAVLQHGYVQATPGEGFCHFEADVAGADDDGAAGMPGDEGALDCVHLVDGVKLMHAVCRAESIGTGQARDAGGGGSCSGGHDEPVVADRFLISVGLGHRDRVRIGVDAGGKGAQSQGESGCFEVGLGAVGEVVPVGHVAGEVVGDAADGVVRVVIGDDNRDVSVRVELSGA